MQSALAIALGASLSGCDAGDGTGSTASGGASGGSASSGAGQAGQTTASGGQSSSAGGAHVGSGGAANALDGSTCSLGTSSTCPASCFDSCGADPACFDKCCPETTSYGISCGSRCIDPNKDSANCGHCGNACTAGKICAGGKCLNDCSTPPTAALVASCTSLCAKLGPSCGYSQFPWPNSTGGGNVSWQSSAQCQADCLKRGNGTCSTQMAALADCWSTSLVCMACNPGMCAASATGFGHFPECAASASAAKLCLDDCAP